MLSYVNTFKHSQAEDPVRWQLSVGHFVSVQSKDLHPGVGQRSHLSAETGHVELCGEQMGNRAAF